MSPFAPPRRVVAALAATTVVVLACIAWADRPLALFVHAQGWHDQRGSWLDLLTRLPEILAATAAAVLVATPLRLSLRRPLHPAERGLLAAALSLASANLVKQALKTLFGRAWPETWVANNPSLIHDGVYGFFWLRPQQAFHSFPSGHTTLTFAVMSVLWLAAPRWRWLAGACCAAVVVGLIGMDYHFLGDICAGAGIGTVSGVYVWRGLERAGASPPA